MFTSAQNLFRAAKIVFFVENEETKLAKNAIL